MYVGCVSLSYEELYEKDPHGVLSLSVKKASACEQLKFVKKIHAV